MAKRTGVIIVFLFLFFIIIIGGFLLYMNKDKIFNYNQVDSRNVNSTNSDIPLNSLYLKIYDKETKEIISVNYLLKDKDENGTIHSGMSRTNSYEIIPNLDYDSYVLYLFKNGDNPYYLEKYSINFTENNTKFDLGLYKKARVVLLNGYKFENGKTEIYLNVQQGKLRKPLICIAYHTSINNPTFKNLTRVDIPKTQKMYFDRCFDLKKDLISEYKILVLNYIKEVDIDLPMTITVIDKGFNDLLEESYDDPDVKNVNYEMIV